MPSHSNPERTERERAEVTRRELLTRMGTGLVAITVSSPEGWISPTSARAKGLKLTHFNVGEQRTLDALAEVLLPGARDAGLSHYVDDQLGRDEPLFVLRYMDYGGEYLDFYRRGLRSLNQVSRDLHRQPFDELSMPQQTALVRTLSAESPDRWKGPPAPLFYFVLRNDAVDVFYGTQAGFEKLGIPYMAHVVPPQDW